MYVSMKRLNRNLHLPQGTIFSVSNSGRDDVCKKANELTKKAEINRVIFHNEMTKQQTKVLTGCSSKGTKLNTFLSLYIKLKIPYCIHSRMAIIVRRIPMPEMLTFEKIM